MSKLRKWLPKLLSVHDQLPHEHLGEIRQEMENATDEELEMMDMALDKSQLVGFFKLMHSSGILKRKRTAMEDDPSMARVQARLKELESFKPTLDNHLFASLAMPTANGNDYSLGRITSEKVDWSCTVLEIEGPLEGFWRQFVLEENPETNILTAVEGLGLEVYVVNENQAWHHVRAQYESFMEVVKAVMDTVYQRLGLQKKVTYDCVQMAATTNLQYPDGLLLVDGSPRMPAEGKTHVLPHETTRKEQTLDYQLAEARGEMVRLANQYFRAKYYAKRTLSGVVPDPNFTNTVRGFTFSGRTVQAVTLVHSVIDKPKGIIFPLESLLKETEGSSYIPGQKYPVDALGEGMKNIVWHCANEAYKDVKLQAKAEVQSAHWREGEEVKVRASCGYRIGDKLLRTSSAPVVDEPGMMVTVKQVARASTMSIVVSVVWNGEVWWLKLGPNRDERQVAMEISSSEWPWEAWFQVERDIFCHSVLNDKLVAFPVEVDGMNRPAMMVQDAGVSLAEKLVITPEEVTVMSKQLYDTLAQVYRVHGISHNDVAPRNICFKDGVYRLIDWGMACGPGLDVLIKAVDEAWPRAMVKVSLPPIVDWMLCPDSSYFYVQPQHVKDSVQGLLYCCLMLLNGTVPWKEAAASGSRYDVLRARDDAICKMNKDHTFLRQNYIFKPLVDTCLLEKSIETM